MKDGIEATPQVQQEECLSQAVFPVGSARRAEPGCRDDGSIAIRYSP
jgi:hypothetical protein